MELELDDNLDMLESVASIDSSVFVSLCGV